MNPRCFTRRLVQLNYVARLLPIGLACTLLLGAGASQAEPSCKNPIPVAQDFQVFSRQVTWALQASLRGKGEYFYLRDLSGETDRRSITAPYAKESYCRGEEPRIGARIYRAGYNFSTSLEDAKQFGLIDAQCRRERQQIRDNRPVPKKSPEMRAQEDRISAERGKLLTGVKIGSPELQARKPELDRLEAERKALVEPFEKEYNAHVEETRRQEDELEKQCIIKRAPYARGALDITILLNGTDNKSMMLSLGQPGRIAPLTKQVKQINIYSLVDNKRSAEQNQALIARMIDIPSLQALIDGKIPSLEESKARIDQQSADRQAGELELRRHNEAVDNAHRAAAKEYDDSFKPVRAQASSNVPAASSAAPSPSAAPAAQNSSGQSGGQASAPAPAAPAPTAARPQVPAAPNVPSLPNVPGNVGDGLNKLKGLFGR